MAKLELSVKYRKSIWYYVVCILGFFEMKSILNMILDKKIFTVYIGKTKNVFTLRQFKEENKDLFV